MRPSSRTSGRPTREVRGIIERGYRGWLPPLDEPERELPSWPLGHRGRDHARGRPSGENLIAMTAGRANDANGANDDLEFFRWVEGSRRRPSRGSRFHVDLS